MAKAKVLLLDFDGVIIKKHPLFAHVNARCKSYIGKYTNIRNPDKVREINDQLYASSGHTLLGLQKLGYSATRQDFNRHVYDFLDYSCLGNLSKETTDLKNLLQLCKKNNISVRVFSNSPEIWVHSFLRAMQCSQVPVLATNSLKPEESCYTEVENMFQNSEIYFVDDKIVNLIPVLHRERWTPVLFSQSLQDNPCFRLAHNMYMVNNLSNISVVLEGQESLKTSTPTSRNISSAIKASEPQVWSS